MSCRRNLHDGESKELPIFKFRTRYAIASLSALMAFSAAVQAQSSPPAWSPTTNYKIGDEVAYLGVDFKCLINETTTHPNPHSLSWGITNVFSGILNIPVGPSEVVHNITQAWTYIADARIANNSSIIIKLDSNYTETFTSSFSLDHPFGGKISIVGHNVDAVATFTGKTAGFTLDNGFHLADLEGFEMVGPNGGTAGNAAIQVSQNSCLAQLKNMNIQNFDVGLFANSGVIDNVSNIEISQFVGGGISAANNATITIIAPITIDGATTVSPGPPGYAFSSSGGATLNCSNCVGKNCQANFYASFGGRLLAGGSTSNSTAPKVIDGYYALQKGYILADTSQASGCFYGYNASNGGYISANGSTATNIGNTGYIALIAGIIDATAHVGNPTYSVGTNDASSVIGF